MTQESEYLKLIQTQKHFKSMQLTQSAGFDDGMKFDKFVAF